MKRQRGHGALYLALLFCTLSCDLALALRHHQRKALTTDPPVRHIQQPEAEGQQAGQLPSSWRVPQHVKFYVQEVPSQYSAGAEGIQGTALRGYGFQSLGDLLSPEHELWNSHWHANDLWYCDQFRGSPLRTYNTSEADVVFVAASFAIKDAAVQNDFIVNAPSFLPLLNDKPHLLVLNHAATTYLQMRSQLITHPNARRFTMISVNPQHPGVDLSHLVSSPYFFHKHYSRGSQAMQPGASFDAEATQQQKTRFAVESFLVRLPDRIAVARHCTERPELCTHLEFGKMEDAVAVWEAMKEAWYGLHPRGDFFNRGAWYDTLLADSIPVVFEAGYDGTLPFREVVDYQRIMQLVPLERIIGDSAENALDILKADFDAHTALDRLKYIREVKHLFQYMLNPLHELIRMDQIGMIAQEDDAFTMTVKSALTNMCQRGLLPSVRCTAGRVPPRT